MSNERKNGQRCKDQARVNAGSVQDWNARAAPKERNAKEAGEREREG